MGKLVFIGIVSLFFTISTVFASPNKKSDVTNISNIDTQLLFGSTVEKIDILVLGNKEMLQTNAKGWWSKFKRKAGRWLRKNKYRIITVIGKLLHQINPSFDGRTAPNYGGRIQYIYRY